MTLGVVAYKDGRERQCPSKRTRHASNPHPNLKLLDKEGPGNRVKWNHAQSAQSHTVAQHKPGHTCRRTTADFTRATSITEHLCTKAVTLFTQGPDHMSTTGSR